MRDLLPPPIHDQSLPLNSECKTDSSESELPPLPGFVGAAAMMFLGIAMWKMLLSKRKPLPPYYLTPEHRGLLMKVIARGEEKRWDFSYDEDFMFKLLPALKAIARKSPSHNAYHRSRQRISLAKPLPSTSRQE